MPELIRTPEQIFREEGKDIYFIKFSDRHSPARMEMLNWLSETMPGARVESLGPSEYSGVIEGYFGDLRIDFSESDLAKYCARWEDAAGKSLDPRFQCWCNTYQTWLDEVTSFILTNERPSGPGLTIWWDTPLGFVYNQISLKTAAKHKQGRHPGNPRDIWFNATRNWPQLASLDPDKLAYGDIFKDSDGHWKVIYTNDGSTKSYKAFEHRQKDLIKWFRLPADTEVSRFEW